MMRPITTRCSPVIRPKPPFNQISPDMKSSACSAAVDSPIDLEFKSSAASVEVIPGGVVEGEVRPPGSKSLTNRALICAAFASGASRLSGALVSEDTEVMIASLSQIGVRIRTEDAGRTLIVDGISSPPKSDRVHDMSIANSGTTVRFLTAALSALGGNYRLHGVDRMHERPIGDLVDAIAPALRGSITAVSPGGCPPVEIRSSGWTGEPMSVAGGVSSQYLSGLMMAGPIASRSLSGASIELKIVGELVSLPYVQMTAELMKSFGGETKWSLEANGTITSGGVYHANDYAIEPDASAASYFWAAAAVAGGCVRVHGLTPRAMQGDVGFVDVLEQMGCVVESNADSISVQGGKLRGVDVDMASISDTVQTLSVVALFADSPTRVRGVAHNRFKETDRIGNLAIELRKLGARIDEHDDGLTIYPIADGLDWPVTLSTYHDHRMAMSFAVAGLRLPGVRIENPACTGKTYPEFWADLECLTGRPHRWCSGGEGERT